MTTNSEDRTDDGDASTHQPIRTNWADHGTPTTGIVRAVSAATGTDPRELDPLQHVADAEALDALLTGGGDESSPVRVSFCYGGVSVTVDSTGRVEVRDEEYERT